VLPHFNDLEAELRGILSSGMVTKGRHLWEFEEAVGSHLGVRHAVAVSSCTVGLMLVYKALGLTGDVVVPSFTFMATVSALVWAGARPVFADVDPETTNLDPVAAEAAITEQTCAIVAVHNFGNPAAIDELDRLAKRRGIPLVFDAAHGFGARYQGVPVGKQGKAHVYSLSPTKLLIAGEGGIVATDDDALAGQIRIGREYGNSGSYDSAFAGLNGRLAEFNALLGLRSLDQLEAAAQRRNEVAALYQRELGEVPGIGFQAVRAGDRCSYKDFSVVVDEGVLGISRDTVADALAAENIDTRKYYDPPVHRQMPYKHFPSADSLAATEHLSRNSLSLPLWSDMDDTTALRICEAVSRIARAASEVQAAAAERSQPVAES